MEHLIKRINIEVQELVQEGRGSEAIYFLETAASEILNLLALMYYTATKKQEYPTKVLELARELNKTYWITHSNLSHLYHLQDKYPEARKSVLKAIETSENQSDAYYNAGVILTSTKEIALAKEMYDKAIEIDDTVNMYKYNKACCLLTMKQYEEGWDLYDIRLKTFDKAIIMFNRFSCPYWNGEDLTDKHLFIFSEQGVGDLIQFLRYIPLIKAKKITFEAQHYVCNFIKFNYPHINVVPRQDDNNLWGKPEDSDYCISICSLAKIFKSISDEPYLKTEKKFDLPKDKLNVGICWKGSHVHQNDHLRSCSSDLFKQLRSDKVRIYSLQKDQSDEFKEVCDLITFSDTANAINSLDLIITIDTSVAHLAGALGKKVWNLLHFTPDWRWGLEGENTEWYKDMKLIRQDTYHDWDSVLNKITKKLESIQVPEQ